MPKLKTSKSAKKRIRITKSGRAKHYAAGRGHLLTCKASKRKRRMGRDGYVSEGELLRVQQRLPFGA